MNVNAIEHAGQVRLLAFRVNSSINSLLVSTICVYMMIADHGLEANPLL